MNRISKNHLLLISADPAIRRQIAEPLEEEGFRVLLAETGQRGLKSLRDYLVDGVILDYGTPFGRNDSSPNKSKTLEAITDASPFLPLILICRSTAELSHSASLMSDIILVDPVEPGTLLDAVETVLQETLRERARRKAGSIAVLR